jgi:hypothetical protein
MSLILLFKIYTHEMFAQKQERKRILVTESLKTRKNKMEEGEQKIKICEPNGFLKPGPVQRSYRF